MEKPLSTASDLRSALLPWIILSLAAGVVGYLAAAFVTVKWLSQLLSSLASAAVSIGVALLITEYILKPLYLRDILHVAKLSAEIHDAGVVTLRRLSQIDITDFLAPNEKIDVAGQPELIHRLWPSLLDWASATAISVRLHLPAGIDAEHWRTFEKAWKDRGCARVGSTLVLTDALRDAPILSLLTSNRCVVAVSDASPSAGNPLVVAFTLARSVPYVHSVVNQIRALSESRDVPLYDSSKEIL